MKDLQQLKSVIQAAVPSIMELKFGCEVKVLFDDSDYYGKVPKEWVKTTINEVSPKGVVIRVISKQINDIDVAKRTEAGELKILGRPITLADVLLALQGKVEFITPYGEFTNIQDYGQTEVCVAHWDLTKTFDDQSQEFYDFISKVLGV